MRLRPQVRKLKASLATWSRVALLALSTIVVLAAGTWTAVAHVVPYVTTNEYFRLRSVRIACDEPAVEPRALAEMAGLYDDTSLWQVDPAAIEGKLREQSWVHEAHVSRRFPWQVSMKVSRRRAVAAAVTDGRVYLVDRQGALFREVAGDAAPDLPYLSGWDQASVHAERAARLLTMLRALEKVLARSWDVSELHMDADGTLWLFAASLKASVRLGDVARVETALDNLRVAISELGPLADRARVIDVDYKDRIVIRGADDKLPALLAAQAERAEGGAAAMMRPDSGKPSAAAAVRADKPSAGARPAASKPSAAATRAEKPSAAATRTDKPSAAATPAAIPSKERAARHG
ncbi:MAG TPA: cell division protein FtsQ/DivIB [Candidatus Binatia bacterium]|nr:cell division protein FtsQ/DivIB [Candidatus Binatia bacterium]